ncbi:GGDEF domain-containing protein [Dermatobacter hominis]|uniref:GGDEF domain-containing protein n=1 Tax=Dermatobacter hominis TaxID=2884263 RepID=UPI001D128478|nr:GGDEF domain-containing protein [Dermatobacter hominis]UDY35786.1 GGDEF domain-containing protein [Dermatobacter hominis]
MTATSDAAAPDELIGTALAALGERFSTGVLLFDRSLDVLWASGATESVLGWADGALVGANALDLVHPDDFAMVISVVEPVLDDPEETLARPTAARTVELLVRIKAQDGSWRPVLVAGRVVDLDGHMVVTARPGEERHALDRVLQLLGHGDHLNATLDAVIDVVRAHFLMQSVCLVHSYDGRTTVDGDPAALVGADPHALLQQVRESLSEEIRADAERWICPVLSHSRESVLGVVVLPVPRLGEPTPYDATVMQRITSLAALAFERAQYDRSLNHDATIDHLTGSLNRRSFERRLMGLAVGGEYPVAVLFVDLDGFKGINDVYGHAIGDAVLVAVAGRLAGAVRGGDFVGRLGGDEFVVACPGLPLEDVEAMATRVREATEGQVLASGRMVDVGMSLGVAVAMDDDELVSVIDRSDSSMYRDKQARRGEAPLRLP